MTARGKGPAPEPNAADDVRESERLDESLRVVRLDLAFDGAKFSGWQRQAEDRSVQAVLEDTLSRILSASTAIVGAGRTDAGVHADGMVASFRTASRMPAEEIARALDALLPEDVGVLSARDAPPGFHALRDARWKWYRYAILESRLRRIDLRRVAWRVAPGLDPDAMRRAAAAIVGRRDFAAFQNAGSPRRTSVRSVAALRLASDGPLTAIDVVADGFLYGMVRSIAGTLVEVGRGRRDPASIPALLESRDRRRAGAAAPAHGLRLVAVGFEGDEPPAFVDPSLRSLLESGPQDPSGSDAERSTEWSGS